ncbi:hypothetical protein BJ912DRAFT_931392 [Pholiota molesta]|nr:hypothetical protein BJ912DRAFT_931392 [Pholiota molesta]
MERPAPQSPNEIPEIKTLIQKGFTFSSRLPRPILDCDGRIVALIAGAPPRDTTYDKDAHDLFKIIIEESDSNTFTKKELVHKRGDFPAINFGYTLPHGYNNPINLDTRHHKKKIDRFRSSLGFTRISAFQNAAFAFWNPGVYLYQKSRIEQLLARHPELKRTAEKTIFPTTAFNFRNVCCRKHRDTQNCPFGWCSITALGEFDHTQGGHLILDELKLIIEFPHAYIVFIPSATVTHYNIPIGNAIKQLKQRR